jgi:hypothetical protein
MAIIGMYSFDYSTYFTDMSIVSSEGVGNCAFATWGRTGPRCCWFKGATYYGDGWASFPFGLPLTTAWGQAAIYVTSPTVDQVLMAFTQGSGVGDNIYHVTVMLDYSDMSVYANRGTGSGTEIGRSDPYVFTGNAWMFVEAYVELHDSAGRLVVKVNGLTVIDYTGDTQNGGSYIDYLMMRRVSPNDVYVDDLITGDGSGSTNTSPPGDARVEYIVPNGAGTRTQFTSSSGTNWSTVDESSGYNDTDYNWSANSGDIDTFGMSSLSGTGVIHGIQTVLRTRKDDAGYRTAQPVFYKAIGTGDTPRTYAGTAQSVGDTFAYKREVFETSPDTGLAWGIEEIEAMEFGYAVGGAARFSVDAWTVAP